MNPSENKHQEEDSRKLIESQENVFLKLSQVLSQSSYSTNIGDLEESQLQGMDNSNYINETEVDQSNWVSVRELRNGKVIKIQTGFVLQSQNVVKDRNRERWDEGGDVEMGDSSQKSVSLLQGCCQMSSGTGFPLLYETCINSDIEMIDLLDEDEPEGRTSGSGVKTVDGSTQTEPPTLGTLRSSGEKEITTHAKFIGSVVKLKEILLSKKKLSEKTLWNILNKPENASSSSSEDEEQEPLFRMDADVERGPTVSKETIAYLLRSTNAENVFRDTVRALLLCLEEVLNKDLWRLARYWKNSVFSAAVDMLNQAVDCEVRTRKLFDLFLSRTIDSILNNDSELKNLELESKTTFVVAFCQSTYLSYTAISYIIDDLKVLKTINTFEPSSIEKKTAWATVTKNSYCLLRMLEALLESFKAKVEVERVGHAVVREAEVKDFSVLNMWKKHWSKEAAPEKPAEEHWKTKVKNWCRRLDDLLLHCVTHLPISAMAVERCGGLAKDILQICRLQMIQDRTQNPSKKLCVRSA